MIKQLKDNIKELKTRILESERPVGTKRPNRIHLPPEGHVYGLFVKKDLENAGDITNKWKVHRPSSTRPPSKNFIEINKLGIKMNATNYATNKDFRKTADIRQKIRVGHKTKKAILPDDSFTYGMPYRIPIPIKDLIQGVFGNQAEQDIRNEYNHFCNESNKNYQKTPRVIARHYNEIIDKMKIYDQIRKRNGLDIPYNQIQNELESKKPVYKMKMFKNVESKVSQRIKEFKTYHPNKKLENKEGKMLDNLIEHIQEGVIDKN